MVLLFLILAAMSLGAEVGPDVPDPSWRWGPVRYLLIVKEDQGYNALKSDRERAVFIDGFWAALDPTPGTLENERRAEFWRRVEESNRLFREGMMLGWKTDRGKFYILLGPPDERKQQGPYEVWKYVALPNPDADPEVIIRFRRNSNGEYHVGLTKLEYWDPSQETDGPAAGETFLGVRTKNGGREMMKGRLRMSEFPRVAVHADFATTPLLHQLRYDFYKVNRSSTRVVVTLAVPRDQFRTSTGEFETPDLTMSVAVDDVKKGKPVGSFSTPMKAVSEDPTPTDRPLLLQGSFTIEPGSYKAMINIVDRRSHRGVTRRETLDAPDFGRALALSSAALGRLREESQVARESDGQGSRQTGRTLVPEPASTFRPEDTILLVYEVYNVSQGGGPKPDLDVQYEFFMITEGSQRQVGQAVLLRHQLSDSLAYSLPLRGWPQGLFRIKVLVTDNRSGEKAEGQVGFQVSVSAP
jgi:GWxTD domain-containing protein